MTNAIDAVNNKCLKSLLIKKTKDLEFTFPKRHKGVYLHTF